MGFCGERFEFAAGDYRAVVTEVGATLAGLWLGDDPVTVENAPDRLPPKSSGAVLAPWPNRIRDGRYSFEGTTYQLPLTEPAMSNASHGLVKWVRWTRLAHDVSSVTLAHDVVPQTGYPFEIRLILRYTLDATTGLTVELTATNTGESPAPFGAGFHPYLDLASHDLNTAQLLVPAATVLQTDSRQIPVGRLPAEQTPFDFRHIRPIGAVPIDHGFGDLAGAFAVLRTERRAVELHFQPQWKYLQIFTAPAITPGRNAVAIEPMSSPADAFNSGEGLIRLEAGSSWKGSWSITVAG